MFCHNIKGLRPYYVISYNKQGSFKMITDDYNNGPRVVRKDYVQICKKVHLCLHLVANLSFQL